MNGHNKALWEHQWHCWFADLCAIVVVLRSNDDISTNPPSHTAPLLIVSILDSRTLGVQIFQTTSLRHISDIDDGMDNHGKGFHLLL